MVIKLDNYKILIILRANKNQITKYYYYYY